MPHPRKFIWLPTETAFLEGTGWDILSPGSKCQFSSTCPGTLDKLLDLSGPTFLTSKAGILVLQLALSGGWSRRRVQGSSAEALRKPSCNAQLSLVHQNSLLISWGSVELAFGWLVEDDLNLPGDLESCTADDDLYGLSLPFVSLYKASTFKGEEGQADECVPRQPGSQERGFLGGVIILCIKELL